LLTTRAGDYEFPDELIRYLTFLHDFIAMANKQIADVLSPEAAYSLLSGVSERALAHFNISEDPKQAMDDVKLILTKFGMKFESVAVGDTIIARFECPFASTIHPLIGKTGAPICPMSVLVLAASKRAKRNARIKKMTLHQTGTQIEIGAP
jgi:hypothetical protein